MKSGGTPQTSSGADSPAREMARKRLLERAKGLIGATTDDGWDWRRGPLTPLDVFPFAAEPHLREAMLADYQRDPGGYRKIGGGANTPKAGYFLRRHANVRHCLQRMSLYYPRGGPVEPKAGMVVFFEWPEDRGRFNFKPDRSAIIESVDGGVVTRAVMAVQDQGRWRVRLTTLSEEARNAVVAFGDCPGMV
ncbi:MAG: hypothetical protein AB2A00_00880 [Myxococcota bacterium]